MTATPDPPRPGSLPEAPEHRDGQTTPVEDAVRAPLLPHERDESSASQQRPPDATMQQAHDDVERGLADTSGSEETDETYRRNLRSEPPAAPADAPNPPRKSR